jgi:hypothetical protein
VGDMWDEQTDPDIDLHPLQHVVRLEVGNDTIQKSPILPSGQSQYIDVKAFAISRREFTSVQSPLSHG